VEVADKESDPANEELGLEKRPLEDLPDDRTVDEKEAEDVQGGRAPPYVPVGPAGGES
jgi:hypothetical protein